MIKSKAILLLEDKILLSTEFNGNMGRGNYGLIFYDGLSKVKNEEGFAEFIKGFNSIHHQYEENTLEGLVHKGEISKFYDKDYSIYFTRGYSKRFSSDYIFIKNMTARNIVIKLADKRRTKAIIRSQHTMCFHFGKKIVVFKRRQFYKTFLRARQTKTRKVDNNVFRRKNG